MCSTMPETTIRRLMAAFLCVCGLFFAGCGATESIDDPLIAAAETDGDPTAEPGAIVQLQPQPAEAVAPQAVGADADADADKDRSAVILEIKGTPILAREILDVIRERHRRVFDQVVQDLMIKRVLELENRSIGILIPKKLVEQDVREEFRKAESYAQVQFQMGIAKLLKRQGRSLERFKQAAREKSRYRHTLYRMVRFDQLRNGAIKVRHIVVKDPEQARLLLGKIRQGADFIKLAEQHSTCPSRKVGGLLPMVSPGFLSSKSVELAVFKLRTGQVSSVVKSDRGYHLFRVVYRHEKRQAIAYRTLEPQVVASLKRYPLVGEVEINFWLDKLRKKYPLKQHF